jgi:hypothetical protein
MLAKYKEKKELNPIPLQPFVDCLPLESPGSANFCRRKCPFLAQTIDGPGTDSQVFGEYWKTHNFTLKFLHVKIAPFWQEKTYDAFKRAISITPIIPYGPGNRSHGLP